jgi:hypothetical protein
VPHIFERFYRSSAARGMPGAGLGLAIVGQVAHANGGTVDMRTGPAGSTFILAFPPLAPSPLSAAPGSGPGATSTPVQPPLETKDATPASWRSPAKSSQARVDTDLGTAGSEAGR